MKSPHIERLNCIFRVTCLNQRLFNSAIETHVLISNWQDEYNTV